MASTHDLALTPATRALAVNANAFDRFTIGHAATGVILGLKGVSFITAFGLALAWELVEGKLKEMMPQFFPFPSNDSLGNAAVDILAVMAGWGAMQMLPPITPPPQPGCPPCPPTGPAATTSR